MLEGVDKQQASDFSGAMLAYNSFVTDHAASPLVNVARTKIASIFTENKPADFVNEDLCKQIDQLLTNDLVPKPDTNLPPVYFACGQLYENTEVSWLGIDYFERFLSGYPDHPLAPEVKSALLRAIVDSMESMPWYLYVAFFSYLGTYILYPIWTILLGRNFLLN